jgi:hypothetical protein
LYVLSQIPLKVREGSKEEAYCNKHDYSHESKEGHGLNSHGIAAINRTKAIRHALGLLADQGKKSCVELWGNDRTQALVEGVAGFPLKIRVTGAIISPADILRRSPDADDALADCLLLVNVYECGNQGAFSPAVARDLMARYSCDRLIWCGHTFPDACGEVDETGAYVRLANDTVTARASVEDRIYGPHAALTWMLADGGANDVAWTHVRAYGSHVIVLFFPMTNVIADVKVPPSILYRQEELPDFRHWWTELVYSWFPTLAMTRIGEWCGVRKVRSLISRSLVSQAREGQRAVKLSQFSYRQTVSLIHTAVKARPWKTIFECFPALRDELVESAARAVVVETANEVHDLRALNVALGEDLSERSRELNALGKAPNPRAWSSAWALLALLFFAPVRDGLAFALPRAISGLARVAGGVRPLFLNWTPLHPLLGPFAEEGLRQLVLQGTGFVNALALPVAVAFSLLEPEPQLVLIPHLLIAGFAWVNPWLGLAYHLMHNAVNWWYYGKPYYSKWTSFKDDFLEAHAQDLVAQSDTDVGWEVIPVTETRIRDRADAPVRADPVRSVFVEHNNVEQLLHVPARESFHFASMACNAPWFVPGISGAVSRTAIVFRSLRQKPFEDEFGLDAVPEDRLAEAKREALQEMTTRWRTAILDVMPRVARAVDALPWAVTTLINREEVLPAWLEHLPAHNKMKLVRALEQIDVAKLRPRAIKRTIKRNEKLFKRNAANVMEPIARTIDAVDPTIIAYTGPEVYEAQQRMKKVFSARRFSPAIHMADGSKLYLIFGPMSDVSLADTVTQASRDKTDVITLCIAGDDSIVWLHHSSCGFVSLEGDMSQFDQSQFGPTIMAEEAWSHLFGMTPEVISALKGTGEQPRVHTISGSAITASSKPEETERCTGGSNTTMGGSAVNSTAWMRVLNALGGVAGVARRLLAGTLIADAEREFLYLGYKIKLRLRWSGNTPVELVHPFVGSTFLKFVMLPARHIRNSYQDLVLLPVVLPSRIIKVGVSLRAPPELYPEFKFSYGLAAAAHMHDQCVSLASFWLPTTLELLVERFQGRTLPRMRTVVDPEDEYRISSGDRTSVLFGRDAGEWTVDRTVEAAWMQSRYQVSQDLIDQTHGVLAKVKVPCLLYSPLYEAMARADYA